MAITLVCVVAAVICAFLNQKEVALAFVAFVGGLWMHSGREAKTLAVLMLALSACQPAQPGFTAEIGARIGQAPPSAQSLTMSPLAGGISVGRVELKPDAAPSCTSGYACLYANSSDNLLYTVDGAGLTLKMHAAQSFRTSANCSGLSSPAQGDVCYDTGLGVFRFRDGSGWTTAATNGSLYVTLAGIQTISGAKTFTAATVFNGAVTLGDAAADVVTNKGTLRIDNTANTFYVSLTHAASANRAVTLPDAAGQIVLDSAPQTLTNKIIGVSQLSGQVAIANGGTGAATTSQNYVFAGPSSGGGAPSFRLLTSSDISGAVLGSSISFVADSSTLFVANDYWSYAGTASSGTTTLSPWVAPCDGTLQRLRVQANSNSAGATAVTVHRSAGGATISYSGTSITCTASTAKFCSDVTHTYSATAGDLFLLRVTGANWTGDGMTASLQFACTG